MIGGDGINDESNKTAPPPIAQYRAQYYAAYWLSECVSAKPRVALSASFPTAQLRQHHDEQDDRHNRGQQIGDGLRGDYTLIAGQPGADEQGNRHITPCLLIDSTKAPTALPADWKVQVVTITTATHTRLSS